MAMRQTDTVVIVAEGHDMQRREEIFPLHVVVSDCITDERAREISGDIIGSTAIERAIMTLPMGWSAILPAYDDGLWRVIDRVDDGAILRVMTKDDWATNATGRLRKSE